MFYLNHAFLFYFYLLQIDIMRQSSFAHFSVHKQSFHSISLAFRKLLDRVASAEVRSTSTNNNTKRSSIGSLNASPLTQQKQSSLRPSLRKNSYFSQNLFANSKRSKTQLNTQQKWRAKWQALNSAGSPQDRSKSTPSFSKFSAIYNKINDYNCLLITKSFHLEQETTPPLKRSLKSPFRKHPNSRQGSPTADESKVWQSRVREKERRKKYKSIRELKSKSRFCRMGDFEPWQTEKGEECCLIQ